MCELRSAIGARCSRQVVGRPTSPRPPADHGDASRAHRVAPSRRLRVGQDQYRTARSPSQCSLPRQRPLSWAPALLSAERRCGDDQCPVGLVRHRSWFDTGSPRAGLNSRSAFMRRPLRPSQERSGGLNAGDHGHAAAHPAEVVGPMVCVDVRSGGTDRARADGESRRSCPRDEVRRSRGEDQPAIHRPAVNRRPAGPGREGPSATAHAPRRFPARAPAQRAPRSLPRRAWPAPCPGARRR